jgi:two-component system, LytTR family, sensor kinase
MAPETPLSTPHQTYRKWLGYGLIVVAVWGVVAIISGIQSHLNALGMDYQSSLREKIFRSLRNYSLFAFLTPFAIVVARRFRLTRDHWMKPLIALIVGFGLFSLAWSVLRVTFFPIHITKTGQLVPPSLTVLQDFWVSNFEDALWMYFPIVCITYAVLYYRDSRQRQLAESQLQTQLARAQLSLLQAQLHPHFLFNTLHAISTLMNRDVTAARSMIVRLSDLLRLAMQSVQVQEVTLKRELEFVDNYLEIEKIRFQDRLTVQLEIAPETLDALVPNLLLQPLVENAVRYGVAMQPGRGWVRIASRREYAKLVIEIDDSGPGISLESLPQKEGVGLSNTRSRLARLYGAAQKLELTNRSERGLRVSVVIPFQTAAPLEGEAFYENQYAHRG